MGDSRDSITKMVTTKESASYGLYFLGQNIFYMLIFMYLNTYYTDIGISAAAVAVIALVVKVWDAVNDPIFGALMDKVHFKKGTFVPWLRISLVGIPVATIIMFATPVSLSAGAKIAWAVVAYMLWDTAYTLCDVPIFGLVTTMTKVQQERTTLNAIGRVCAMIAAVTVMVVIPSFREKIGGWTATVVMLSVIGAITMLPICFTAKERVGKEADASGENPEYGLKDIFTYMKSNKYLLIYYLAFLVAGATNLTAVWGLYIARICLHDESIATIISLCSVLPIIILGIFVPALTKKTDKFKIYFWATAAQMVLYIARFFVGYSNTVAFMIAIILVSLPYGFTQVLSYMFTPDCAEYGHYISGKKMPGITFATQTFFAKLESAFLTALSSVILVCIGFIEGENAVQVEGFADKMWAASCFVPAIGLLFTLVILKFYKLNDHDVELMAKVNSGELTREDAQKQMINKY